MAGAMARPNSAAAKRGGRRPKEYEEYVSRSFLLHWDRFFFIQLFEKFDFGYILSSFI